MQLLLNMQLRGSTKMDNLLPTHVGIIMDGNRRWAKQRGLNANKGHEAGANNLRKIARHAFSQGVKYLTVYAFSTENWQRSQQEVNYLMKLAGLFFEKYLNEFIKEDIRVIILGSRQGISKQLLKIIANTEEATKDNQRGTLSICFNYGGRQEIIDAVNSRIKMSPGILLDDATLTSELYGPREIPNIDIVLRTSGEQRISNFMLWRIAYSELYFIDKHWPDFNEVDFDILLAEYSRRNRRFGG